MTVLSIQSHVVYGRVGNAVATFLLQRMGIEVWPVMTVQLSNHTGYGSARGRVFAAEEIRELLLGLEERAVLSGCRAVLSGYLGTPAIGAAVLDGVAKVKAARPDALYCCDPVMGDTDKGLYVRDELPAFFREEALPAADILTPNLFELEILSGRALHGEVEILAAARDLLALGPRVVLVSSVAPQGVAPETAAAEIAMLAVTAEAAFRIATPRLALDPAPNGTGDALAAVFLGHLLQGHPPERALAGATDAIFRILEATGATGSRELRILDVQDRLFAAGPRFAVSKAEEAE